MSKTKPIETWDLDREIVISRVLDAPRERVYRAWTDAERIGTWFAPKGFTCKVRQADIRVGGSLRFDFVAPGGHVYDNRITYLELTSPSRVVFDHGHDRDDDPEMFRVTLTLDAQSNGKTVLTLRQLHPTKELRDGKIGFGAVEIGQTTLDSLEAFVRAQ